MARRKARSRDGDDDDDGDDDAARGAAVLQPVVVPAHATTFKALFAHLKVPPGNGYYALGEKAEKVAASKRLLAVNAASNQHVEGIAEARAAVGLPAHKATLSCKDVAAGWTLFVQSTSPNRKLVPGTTVYVTMPAGAAVKKPAVDGANAMARAWQDVLERISEWAGKNAAKTALASRVRASLNGPASAELVAATQARLQCVLPAAVVDAYSVHDGQHAERNGEADSYTGLVLGVITCRLLPMSEWKPVTDYGWCSRAFGAGKACRVAFDVDPAQHIVLASNFHEGGVGVALLDKRSGRVVSGQAFGDDAHYLKVQPDFEAFFRTRVGIEDVLWLWEENLEGDDEDEDDE